jgi:hypothetical protein
MILIYKMLVKKWVYFLLVVYTHYTITVSFFALIDIVAISETLVDKNVIIIMVVNTVESVVDEYLLIVVIVVAWPHRSVERSVV